MKGKFIAIEGGDGAGKDTQIELLKKDFPDFMFTREPGGTALGKELREIVLHRKFGDLPLLTEAFLFLADRAQHVATLVTPSILAGKTVVSNRSWISMMAYQVYGRNRHDFKPVVEASVEIIYRDMPFDLAIILDVPVEVGLERQKAMGKEFDVMESVSIDARADIRKGFLETAALLPMSLVIDANRSVEEVYKDVKAAVEKTLQQ